MEYNTITILVTIDGVRIDNWISWILQLVTTSKVMLSLFSTLRKSQQDTLGLLGLLQSSLAVAH
jgi:hypothetical protein